MEYSIGNKETLLAAGPKLEIRSASHTHTHMHTVAGLETKQSSECMATIYTAITNL